MNQQDMERRQLRTGDIARVKSRRGETVVRVAASEEMRPGQTFLPMHWGAQFMNSAGANGLTLGALDPVSKQPELKHAAVRVEKLNLPWQLVVMRTVDEAGNAATVGSGRAAQCMASVKPLLSEFTYATVGLFGRDKPAVIFRAAHETPVAGELIAKIDRLFEFDDGSSLTYLDSKRGISKRVMIEDGIVKGARLTGETAARDWLKDIMAQGTSADTVRKWVLAPVGFAARRKPQSRAGDLQLRGRGGTADPGPDRARGGFERPAGKAEMRHGMRVLRTGVEAARRARR